MLRIIIALGFVSVLSGCTSMLNIGATDYGCAGMPEGVTCVSARDVYSATESNNYETQLMREQNQSARGSSSKKRSSKQENSTTDEARVLYREAGENAPTPARAQNPLPIRSQAVVMRVAVDPWEDDNGDLHIPGYIYTEIEARRWEIGSRSPDARHALRPLTEQK